MAPVFTTTGRVTVRTITHTSNMIYELSNRQLKLLNVSRSPLIIYLPCPPIAPKDLMQWAASRLPSVASMIDNAKIATAICKRSDRATDGPIAAFGFLLDDWSDDEHCYCVQVVSVLLRPEKTGSGIVGPQWPSGELAQPARPRDNS